MFMFFLCLDERKRFEMGGPAGAAALAVFFIALTYLNAEKNVSVSCLQYACGLYKP